MVLRRIDGWIPVLLTLYLAVCPALLVGQVFESSEAAVVVWNRPITVFRAHVDEQTPQQRAQSAAAQISNFLDDLIGAELRVIPAETPEGRVAAVIGGSHVLLAIRAGDLDPAGGQTLEEAGQQAVERLNVLLRAYAEQRNPELLLRALAEAAAVTLAFILSLWFLYRIHRTVDSQLNPAIQAQFQDDLPGLQLRPLLHAIGCRLALWTAIGAALFFTYVWLTYMLSRFAYTRPWGEKLGSLLFSIVGKMAAGFAAGIPELLTLAIIVLIARSLTSVSNSWFRAVESRTIRVPGLDPRTARATRRIVVIAVWLFTVAIAYPHIPGSETQAFKGVSLLIGLVVTLGTAGFVNQIMSGLVLTYSRAVDVGDYVSIGPWEGTISEMGTLSTKITTTKRELVTIPNALFVSDSVKNYSRLASGDGVVVHTSINTGYDVPWRQVHAMLLEAAQRTPGLQRSPVPYVRQKTLLNFSIEYELNAYLREPEERRPVLSMLHQNILDLFNEYGVQIMSPQFHTQPDKRLVVPKSHWFMPPAKQAASVPPEDQDAA